ncbi:MAG: (2Fe-2S)-binding protein [Candidatus Bathyarchaeia archaeon]
MRYIDRKRRGNEDMREVIYPVEFKLNGRKKRVWVRPYETLFEVLREQLGVISVKDMCLGHGACGSCTVLLDGRPVLSCLTLAIDCIGKDVQTVEGLVEKRDPLIDSFLENHAFQCGYCTSGFILTAKALLNKKLNITELDVVNELSGNICRCGTYMSIINAVIEASKRYSLENKNGGKDD